MVCGGGRGREGYGEKLGGEGRGKTTKYTPKHYVIKPPKTPPLFKVNIKGEEGDKGIG